LQLQLQLQLALLLLLLLTLAPSIAAGIINGKMDQKEKLFEV